jgi:hypothetical protein
LAAAGEPLQEFARRQSRHKEHCHDRTTEHSDHARLNAEW